MVMMMMMMMMITTMMMMMVMMIMTMMMMIIISIKDKWTSLLYGSCTRVIERASTGHKEVWSFKNF